LAAKQPRCVMISAPMNTLIPPPIVTATLAALMWWINQQLPELQLTGKFNKPLAYVLVLIALGLMLATVIEFWKLRTTVNPMKPGNTLALATNGVMRLSRNPIYLGDAILLVAWSIWLGSLVALIALPIFVIYINRFQIEPEERALRLKFSTQFERYCNSVRRWI
jgi:protein-S-isoprenylcysteine O-methyltransferase Ste14